MDVRLDGETRVYYVVGDPIAQVKSPHGVTASFQAQGLNAVCLPAHVGADDLTAFFQGLKTMRNVDGLMITVPHKIAFTALCDDVSDTARFLNTVNVVRREGSRWVGDMFDGKAQIEAMRRNGAEFSGKKALLAGAGGAGTAIAHALLQAGVAELAIHETDAARRDHLISRLNGLGLGKVSVGSADPSGFELVVNATPLGMRPDDALPFQADRLTPDMFVADVVAHPPLTEWIRQAQAQGCRTSSGGDMFACVRDLMVDFLLKQAV